MSLVKISAEERDNKIIGKYSDARGPVIRGKTIEMIKMHFKKGERAVPHQHGEEQMVYVIKGRIRATVDGETYEVGPGEVSYHPANSLHNVEILEDIEAISLKNIVAPFYEATKTL